jgi:glycine cleavage system H protein
MSNVPAHLNYTSDHEWVESREDVARVGITDYAQAALGDIVYVQLPKVGDTLEAGKVCGEVESTKSVSDLFSPVTGVVSAVNTGLESAPEALNADPYGAGWIFEVAGGVVGESLSAAAYQSLIGE